MPQALASTAWVAVDVSTDATARAGELRLARAAFLAGEEAAAVREPIVQSWRRAAAAGADPRLRKAPLALDADAARAHVATHPLGRLAPTTYAPLAAVADAAEHLILLADADGVLLSVDGDPRVKKAAAREMRYVPGASLREDVAGTNAIGTSLICGHAVQVFASEHYCEHAQRWTCVAAPVRDPADGRTLGSLGLTARMETVHPHSLALAVTAAAMLEAELRNRTPAHAARPVPSRAVLELRSLGRDRVSAALDRQELVLSQRHGELLVLLAAAPAGLTGERLALALYGDDGKPATARAEVSRLRQSLGRIIRTDPYRLEADVRSDFASVERALREGRIGDAASAYAGLLLPRSQAPGVVALQRELDGWMRRAVLMADDAEPLWAWLNTDAGAGDLHAWKRLLANLPATDGRRGLAAARVDRLRRELE